MAASKTEDSEQERLIEPITAKAQGAAKELKGAEDEFAVEAVLDGRRAGSAVEYLVKWAGFPSSENTWEPEANLQDCVKLLEFKAQRAAEQPVQLVVGDLVDVDRCQARDGGPAKIMSDLGVTYRVRYLCGGT